MNYSTALSEGFFNSVIDKLCDLIYFRKIKTKSFDAMKYSRENFSVTKTEDKIEYITDCKHNVSGRQLATYFKDKIDEDHFEEVVKQWNEPGVFKYTLIYVKDDQTIGGPSHVISKTEAEKELSKKYKVRGNIRTKQRK